MRLALKLRPPPILRPTPPKSLDCRYVTPCPAHHSSENVSATESAGEYGFISNPLSSATSHANPLSWVELPWGTTWVCCSMPLCSPGNCVTESSQNFTLAQLGGNTSCGLLKICDFSHLTVIPLSLNTTSQQARDCSHIVASFYFKLVTLPFTNLSLKLWLQDFWGLDLSSVLSAQVRRFTTPVTPASEDPTPSSRLREYLQSCIRIHTYTHN